MQEVIEFIFSNKEKVCTITHIPDEPDIRRAYVFIHPFAEEKLWSHRVYVSFARELAKQGYYVGRFDFKGHGDSDGDFVDSSLEKHFTDIDAVINNLKTKFQVTEINLFGLRLGATLAAIYASNNNISNLILWEPIINGSRYMQEILRSNLAGQMALRGKVEITREDLVKQMKSGKPINIEGYLLTYDYYNQLSNISLENIEFKESINCLINQIVRNKKQPENKAYVELIKKFSNMSELMKSEEEQFWREIKTFYKAADNLSSSSINWVNRLK
jgi:exosortase A-associated hydrolase 2